MGPDQEGLDLDWPSIRALIYVRVRPSGWTTLSSLTGTPQGANETSVHFERVAVHLRSGERLVLTIELRAETNLVGDLDKGFTPQRRWVISKVRGEPDKTRWPRPDDAKDDEEEEEQEEEEEEEEEDKEEQVPRGPSCEYGPEAVVEAQLRALQERDYARVFAFASPANKEATGPIDRFATMLDTPSYRPLLGHRPGASRRVQGRMTSGWCHIEVVSVDFPVPLDPATWEPGASDTATAVYGWVLGLQTEGIHKGCWMVDSVQPIGDSSGQSINPTFDF